MKKFKAKKGSMIKDKDAMIVGKRLSQLATVHQGEVTPTLVLEDARQKSSPLHTYFEWDNNLAAEKFRLHQARLLLGAVVEVVIDRYNNRKELRSFYNVSNDKKESVYVTLETTLTTAMYLDQIVADAQQEIQRLNDILALFRNRVLVEK